MAESAYAAVLKTAGLTTMWVQVPLAPLISATNYTNSANKNSRPFAKFAAENFQHNL